jgi:hypothetical protein
MGYVKISDPNIIDLNAIHNIINVVNQHSDTLNTLTNNFGAANSTTVNYNAAQMQHLFDSGSQMVVYGRATFDNTLTATNSSSPSGKVYHKTITFADSTTGIPAFSVATPMIFLTIHTANSDTVSTTFADARANVYSPTSSSFKIRLFLQNAIGTNQKVYINWMAIGPKNK